jgi:hypothetical protein
MKIKKGISKWIEKHNKISDRAAIQYLKENLDILNMKSNNIQLEGGKRTPKYTIWNKIPYLLVPFVTFFYQFFLQLGFLDGVEGFLYHFLQAFWYRLIIYIKIRELR